MRCSGPALGAAAVVSLLLLGLLCIGHVPGFLTGGATQSSASKRSVPSVSRRAAAAAAAAAAVVPYWQRLPPDGPRGTAGQRHVFIDLGANDGSSVRFFLSGASECGRRGCPQWQGGGASSPLKGRGADGRWEVAVVEANTRFSPKLLRMGTELQANSRVLHWAQCCPCATAGADGNVSFMHDLPGGDAGATINPDSNGAKHPAGTVPAMTLQTVLAYLGVTALDHVVVKMDIEGAEYAVLRSLLDSGASALVDELAVEWHHDNHYVFPGATGLRYKEESRGIVALLRNRTNVTLSVWG
eukprot:TRINITY_DN15352_c0_g2_i1.p1 TRINITY_DN15352_c0_g2~~TRINITY_DN15352_c0_g2_i1.p1  ORF type:complete len:299 (+),score=46.00 TRINITY_DN15352_c0_g2_i1:84-980(+)